MYYWHYQRYPLLAAQDIYKLIHQGVFGPGHIIRSAASAKRMLEKEVAELAAEVRSQKAECRRQNRRADELIEAIDPTGKLVRLNLRPLLAQGGRMRDEYRKRNGRKRIVDADWLAEAMVESGGRVKGDRELMKRRLSAAVRWCKANLPREAARLEQIAARADESSYPALHHSSAYRRAYRPAYRVILSDYLKRRAWGRVG